MSDDYRDPLAAALSRIEALERENAALKNAQSGRAATAAELQAVRLENELFRLDMQWEAEMSRKYAQQRLDDASLRRARRASTILPAIMVAVAAALGLLVGHDAVGWAIFAMIAGTAALVFGIMRWSVTRHATERASHEKRRERLVREIAKLRGEPLPGEGAFSGQLRVAEVEEVEREEDAPASLAASTVAKRP